MFRFRMTFLYLLVVAAFCLFVPPAFAQARTVRIAAFNFYPAIFQAKDGSNRANGSNITYPDGKKLFLGSSSDDEDPADKTDKK